MAMAGSRTYGLYGMISYGFALLYFTLHVYEYDSQEVTYQTITTSQMDVYKI